MKLLVKTLKGGKFPIEADESATVGAVKAIIVSCLVAQRRTHALS
jgi:hypothetical protein